MDRTHILNFRRLYLWTFLALIRDFPGFDVDKFFIFFFIILKISVNRSISFSNHFIL